MKNNSEFLSSKELQERWRIEPFDLLQLMKQGELRYKIDGEYRIDDDLNKGGLKLWDNTEIQRACLQLSDLEKRQVFFHISDIEAFETEHPKYKPVESPYVIKNGEVPPYLDRNHKNFSKEMTIAVGTWLALYGPSGSYKSKRSHKSQSNDYLDKHHPDLSNDAKKRIATLVNPQKNKKGGTPKIK
jgi:hypothetical protein